jgi:7-cyano-7-deazaguanine synthase in queuosine biosynthesis
LSTQKNKSVTDNNLIKQVIDIANNKGASRIIMPANNLLMIGILNQYRYWTKSRARLCGLDILNNNEYMNNLSS